MPAQRLLSIGLSSLILLGQPAGSGLSGPAMVWPGRSSPANLQGHYRTHPPGYLFTGLSNGGDLLPEGVFRYRFRLRRLSGHLPGLLSGANDAVRLEIMNRTSGEKLAERTVQQNDLTWDRSSPASAPAIVFSTWGRGVSRIEPRVYWHGLTGVALEGIEREDLGSPAADELSRKAARMDDLMEKEFVDADGFVVVRDPKGLAQDYGDAALWTSLYAAALAWQTRLNRSEDARRRMERSLRALHRLHSESGAPGRLVRHPDPEIRRLFPPPHKDTYAGFYFALAQALPEVRDPSLRRALEKDLDQLTAAFLANGFRWVSEEGVAVSFNPYLTQDHWREVSNEFQRRPKIPLRVAGILRKVHWYFSLQRLDWPEELTELERFLRRGHFDAESPPWDIVTRGTWRGLQQARIGIARSAALARAYGLKQSPYQKLERWIDYVLSHLPSAGQDGPRAEDVRVLSSQALHALHILKVASERLPDRSAYRQAYHDNLTSGACFLTTLTRWDLLDEALLHAVSGETRTHTKRSSGLHLSPLILMDLIQLEQQEPLRRVYQTRLDHQALIYGQDFNALTGILQAAYGFSRDAQGMALWSLSRYPEDRRGHGHAWWSRHARRAAAAYGGIVDGKSREARPPDERPRDAFLWQRNPRSLDGDHADWRYPPLDFLFVYWMARSLLSLPQSDRW